MVDFHTGEVRGAVASAGYEASSFDVPRAHSGRDRVPGALPDANLATYVEWWATACARSAVAVTWSLDERRQDYRRRPNYGGAEVSSFFTSARRGHDDASTFFLSLLADGTAVRGRPAAPPLAERPASGSRPEDVDWAS